MERFNVGDRVRMIRPSWIPVLIRLGNLPQEPSSFSGTRACNGGS